MASAKLLLSIRMERGKRRQQYCTIICTQSNNCMNNSCIVTSACGVVSTQTTCSNNSPGSWFRAFKSLDYGHLTTIFLYIYIFLLWEEHYLKLCMKKHLCPQFHLLLSKWIKTWYNWATAITCALCCTVGIL